MSGDERIFEKFFQILVGPAAAGWYLGATSRQWSSWVPSFLLPALGGKIFPSLTGRISSEAYPKEAGSRLSSFLLGCRECQRCVLE
jgi:hypothetical protein